MFDKSYVAVLDPNTILVHGIEDCFYVFIKNPHLVLHMWYVWKNICDTLAQVVMYYMCFNSVALWMCENFNHFLLLSFSNRLKQNSGIIFVFFNKSIIIEYFS